MKNGSFWHGASFSKSGHLKLQSTTGRKYGTPRLTQKGRGSSFPELLKGLALEKEWALPALLFSLKELVI